MKTFKFFGSALALTLSAAALAAAPATSECCCKGKDGKMECCKKGEGDAAATPGDPHAGHDMKPAESK